MKTLAGAFAVNRPILGMLHLAGDGPQAKLDLALEEARIMAGEGVDGLVVENYFGNAEDVERVLERLCPLDLGARIGVNVLRDTDRAFALAARYPVAFIQVDSVCGHLPPDEDAPFAEKLAQQRAGVDAVLLGGVRFKYQPVRSGRDEAEDLRFGAARCDAIVVTSAATGEETDLAKVRRFRTVVGPDFPLLVGAGVTAQNVAAQLECADGAIVGSWLKDTHRDTGRISAAHVAAFMAAVRVARGVLA